MKQRINILILLSAIALVALSVIHCYLVKTTYDYKVAQFHAEIKDEIANITNDYSDIDSTIINKKDLLYNQLAYNYIYDKKTKSFVKKQLLDSDLSNEITRKLQLKFEKDIPNFSIDFAIVLNKFVLYKSSQKADTIFSEKPLIRNKMYGNLASLENAFLVRNYVGTTNGLDQ